VRVIFAILDVESRNGECGPAFGRKRRQLTDIASRPEPEHARGTSRRKRPESIQGDIERDGATRDRRHDFESIRGTLVVDHSEEMHGQVERLRACPSDLRYAFTQLVLQPPRGRQPWLSEWNGEKAPHRSLTA
jgi:hypothetical protein